MAKKEKVYGTHLKVSTKRAGHKIGGTVGIFVFLLVLALFMALPIYLAVVMSLKPVQELFVFPPKLYVIDPTLSNYSSMFRLCSDLWVPEQSPQRNTITSTTMTAGMKQPRLRQDIPHSVPSADWIWAAVRSIIRQIYSGTGKTAFIL